jgi:hypothetical protein
MTQVGSKLCSDCTNSGYDSPDYYCENGPNCINKLRKKEKMAKEDDFGFSTVHETQVQKPSQDKVQGIYNMITPLLDNLSANTENAYIHWPDRATKIAAFKKKLEDYINS